MFCKVCGNKMGNGERFCRKCGSNREIESEIYNYQPRMESGNGLATAGMVIGIIVTIIFSFELFGFILLNALEGISTSEPKYAIYAALLFELVPLITALIGVILSIAGMVKKIDGRGITGLVLSTVAVIEAFILFILLLSVVH